MVLSPVDESRTQTATAAAI